MKTINTSSKFSGVWKTLLLGFVLSTNLVGCVTVPDCEELTQDRRVQAGTEAGASGLKLPNELVARFQFFGLVHAIGSQKARD